MDSLSNVEKFPGPALDMKLVSRKSVTFPMKPHLSSKRNNQPFDLQVDPLSLVKEIGELLIDEGLLENTSKVEFSY